MEEYITFEGRVEPMEWGKATYTVLRLPPAVFEMLAAQGARRVEGEIADHPVNLAISKAPVIDDAFLWAGSSLLDRIGIEPGELVEIRLRKADDDAVEVPEEVSAALLSAGCLSAWETLTPGKRRSLLYPVSTAKQAETRAKRIQAIVAELRAKDA